MLTRLSLVILLSATALLGCADKMRPQNAAGELTTSDEAAAQSSEKNIQAEADDVAPMLTHGEVKKNLPAYKVPEVLRSRLQAARPELVPVHSQKFIVNNPYLHIVAKDHSMTFSGVLSIPGKQDENFEMRCAYDPADTPWACDDMFPTDEKVAAQKRMQATVNCLDVQRCEVVGVEMFVAIDGKTESQLFQNQQFYARKATSGDVDDDDMGDVGIDGVKKLDKAIPQPRARDTKSDLRVQEKVTPVRPAPQEQPVVAAPTPTAEPAKNTPPVEVPANVPVPATKPVPASEPAPAQQPDLNDDEIKQVIDDPNSALEVSAPIPTPRPRQSTYSIPGIEKLRPRIGPEVRKQAVGSHNHGSLVNGVALSAGEGLTCRANTTYGTDSTLALLKGAAAAMDKAFPHKSGIYVSSISKKGGGPMCGSSGCHASHQTGLDADVSFPSDVKQDGLWGACGEKASCGSRRVVSEFDEARFFYFLKTLSCAESKPVIAYFLDENIKKHMCSWVAQQKSEDMTNPKSCAYKALQALKHEPGHQNHVHVRFKCPGNRDCQNATVSLGEGTGC